jgi:hypothetical protein
VRIGNRMMFRFQSVSLIAARKGAWWRSAGWRW